MFFGNDQAMIVDAIAVEKMKQGSLIPRRRHDLCLNLTLGLSQRTPAPFLRMSGVAMKEWIFGRHR